MSLDDLVLPDKYKTHSPTPGVREPFLLGDIGELSRRILKFGRISWLQILQTSNTWYVNSTFATAPKLFADVYVILSKKFWGAHPVLYALLPDKQRATHERMFDFIRTLMSNIWLQSIHCKYRRAVMKECCKGMLPRSSSKRLLLPHGSEYEEAFGVNRCHSRIRHEHGVCPWPEFNPNSHAWP